MSEQRSNEDHAAVRIPPPLIYGAAIVAGGLLDRFVMPMATPLPLGIRIGVAAATGLLGALLMVGAISLFKRTAQDPKPWKTTPEVLSTGVYRFTRNPMYVSMALLQVTVGLSWDSVWIVALVPVSLIVVYLTAIRPEEAYLESKFGRAYIQYKRSVRRWV